MALLLEAILTLALIIAAIKFGWLWTILFVLLYILALSFKLPFLARRPKVTSRFLAFVAVFPTLGLFMRKLVSVILFSADVQKVIAGNLRILRKRCRGYLASCVGSGQRGSYIEGYPAIALSHCRHVPLLS